MKLKIKMPNWDHALQAQTGRYSYISEKDFNFFWRTQVEPINKLLSEGVAVSGFEESGRYFCKPHPMSNESLHTHRALLINIQTIKKETAEDVLRDFLKEYDNKGAHYYSNMDALRERAKVALQRSEGGKEK